MTEWRVVPVEPTSKMVAAYSAAAEDLIKRHHLSGSYPATWQPVEAGYAAILAAAPTPPVVLPPPPQSFTILSRLQSGTEEVVRLDEAIAYARAALAAYGIVDRQEAAA